MNKHQVNDFEQEFNLRDVVNAQKPIDYWRIAFKIIIIVLLVDVAVSVFNNPNFEWEVVREWFTAKTILNGLAVTLGLTVVAMILGTVLGLFLAIARLSDDKIASGVSKLFIWFFRGTPLLVQLLIWYNLSTLVPTISIGIPYGPQLWVWNTNDVISPLTVAIIGLSLNEAAYMAEIIRAGLISVDHGQKETAEAFGMSRSRTLFRIIIPQAMRAIIPPTGNQLISMIKATSLVSVIAMGDLLYSVQAVYNRTFQFIPLLVVAVIWYLLITSILNLIQSKIEKYFAKGDRHHQHPEGDEIIK